MAARLRRLLPWLESADGAVLRAWCEMELIAAAITEQLFEFGVARPDGTPDPMLGELRSLRRVQLSYAQALGLGPVASTLLRAAGKQPWTVDISDEQAQRAIAMSEPEPATTTTNGEDATGEAGKREDAKE